ncbi:MAG: DUF2442 domain-containing protein [Chitinispirillales bacterium]|jgi:hypothetical protein|nr:DUF2442 domain-containing protein [Chitinispirillales bacterium]
MKISVEYKNEDIPITPQIKHADFIGAYSVLLTFSDGATRKVNFGEFLEKSMHPAIRAYLDENRFKKFKIESGNIVWGKNWDLIFPIEQLYKGKISV